MSVDRGFVAEIIETGAGAFAGYAASDLLERQSSGEEADRTGAFAPWKDHFAYLLEELAAAIRAGRVELFSRHLKWRQGSLEARRFDTTTGRDALFVLRETLSRELPPDARSLANEYIVLAIDELDRGGSSPEQGLTADTENGALALRFLEKILEGDRRGAIRVILSAVDAGSDPRNVYTDVLLKVQEEVGRMWHADEIMIGEEHFGTETVRNTMAILAHRYAPDTTDGPTVLSAAVQGNAHDMGVRAVADFFEMEGFKSVCIGSDVPPLDLAQAVNAFGADLVSLSVAMPTQLKACERAIATIRELDQARRVKILVGGRVFRETPDLWKQYDADGFAEGPREAIAKARELLAG